MDLTKYVNEIISIAEANHMAWDIGKDMFVANIQNAGVPNAPYYAGADINYAALKPDWMVMTDEERGKAKNDFDDWYRANQKEIRAKRQKEKVDKLFQGKNVTTFGEFKSRHE